MIPVRPATSLRFSACSTPHIAWRLAVFGTLLAAFLAVNSPVMAAPSLSLPALAGSVEVERSEPAAAERLYPMGSIRRISGRLRYEREMMVEGERSSYTLQLAAPHGAMEAFTQARETLQGQGAQLLYWCQGRECGASNLWANAVFGNATLYGADEQQAYALLRLHGEQPDTVVALYGITRGNRRAYLHIEQTQAIAPLGELLPSEATLHNQLRADGVLRVPGSALPQAPWSTLIARALNIDSTWRVVLKGADAVAWREALVAERVRAARLETQTTEDRELMIERLR